MLTPMKMEVVTWLLVDFLFLVCVIRRGFELQIYARFFTDQYLISDFRLIFEFSERFDFEFQVNYFIPN